MMTTTNLKSVRAATGLTAKQFGQLLRLHPENADRAVRRWESGETEIPGYVTLLCELLQLPAVREYLAKHPNDRRPKRRSKPRRVKLAS